MTLKERRITVGLKQEEVAKELEVDQTAVSNWENGKNVPLKKYQEKLAKLYNCTVEDLIEKEGG